jgi:hypothetical protein
MISLNNHGHEVFAEEDGRILGEIVELRLELRVDTTIIRPVLFLRFLDGSTRDIYSNELETIFLTCDNYTITGSGIQPQVLFKGEIMGRIQHLSYDTNVQEHPIKRLRLEIMLT